MSNNNEKKSTEQTEEKVEKKESVVRPEKSDENARSILMTYDSKVAQVMRNIRELKQSMEDGAKMTPVIEKNITDMIQEAKKAQEDVKPLVDKLAKDDFDLYNRTNDRLREKETDFEAVKQKK